MRDAAVTRRRVGEFARLFLRVFDQFLQIGDGQFRVHRDDERATRKLRNRRHIPDRIERHFVHRRIDRVARSRKQQRVAIGGRAQRQLGTHVAACAGLVVDDYRLPELLAQALRQQPRDEIRTTPRRERHDDLYGFVGVEHGLCGYVHAERADCAEQGENINATEARVKGKFHSRVLLKPMLASAALSLTLEKKGA